jgi:hypothetical protein
MKLEAIWGSAPKAEQVIRPANMEKCKLNFGLETVVGFFSQQFGYVKY